MDKEKYTTITGYMEDKVREEWLDFEAWLDSYPPDFIYKRDDDESHGDDE